MGLRTVLAAALLLAPALAGGATASSFQTEGTPYQAETLWSAKRALDIDEFVAFGRAPWSEEPTGRDVTVGIVDTGVDADHPDLDDKRIRWRDFTEAERARPHDDQGHGTHVAGIAAGDGHLQTNPASPYIGAGARGLAPDADLLVAKGITSEGTGDDARVAEAVRWLVDPNGDGDLSDGADVINLSLGIGEPQETMGPGENMGSQTRQAVDRAIERGVIVVVSSGNEGMNTVNDPGDLEPVITVAATDGQGTVADFSNYGRHLDVAAPGVLVSTFPPSLDGGDGRSDGYVGMAGTSMAAPVVTGMVALLLEAAPGLAEKSTSTDMTEKVLRVQEAVRSPADPPEGAGEEASFGVVNAHGSLLAVDRGTDALDWRAVGAMGVVALLLLRGVLGLRDRGSRVPQGGSEPEAPSETGSRD
jgi:serine protease AprX